MSRPTRSLEQATADFWAKAVRDQFGCLIWQGSRSNGYGKVNWFGKITWAHILAYELTNGRVPEGLEVRHICNKNACIAPGHLQTGTHQQNMMDRVNSGLHVGANQTHCKHGHEFTPENTYIYKGKRNCRTCHKVRQDDYQAVAV